MRIAVNRPIEEMRVWADRAFRWWIAELRALWTDIAQSFRQARGSGITIEAGEQEWLLRRPKQPVTRIDANALEAGNLREITSAAGPVAVLIPPERVLSKTLTLPVTAATQLDRILGFEIARHFPFAAERIFFSYRPVGRPPPRTGSGQQPLTVEVAAVPREIVFAIADELAAAGMRAGSFALLPAANAAPLLLRPDPLIPLAPGRSIDRRWLAAIGLLAAAAVISWPVAQQVRLAAVEREIATLKPTADIALTARSRQQHAAEQQAAIAQLRGEHPPLVVVLDWLSRNIPDGAWLVSLSVNGRDLVLDGLAPSAASIALILQRDPVFSDISFRSPIARDTATGLEHFQLGATLSAPRQ